MNTPKTTLRGYVPESGIICSPLPNDYRVQPDYHMVFNGTHLTAGYVDNNGIQTFVKGIKDIRNVKPFDAGFDNGNIPLNMMLESKWLKVNFDDKQYNRFLFEPSKSLDAMLDEYENIRIGNNWDSISVTKGYTNIDIQIGNEQCNRDRTKVPYANFDPFGFGNQIHLFWNHNYKSVIENGRLRKLINDGILNSNPTTSELILNWLLENGKKYKWTLVQGDYNGDAQWWHWIYDPRL
jgi:hypothetical protein